MFVEELVFMLREIGELYCFFLEFIFFVEFILEVEVIFSKLILEFEFFFSFF